MEEKLDRLIELAQTQNYLLERLLESKTIIEIEKPTRFDLSERKKSEMVFLRDLQKYFDDVESGKYELTDDCLIEAPIKENYLSNERHPQIEHTGEIIIRVAMRQTNQSREPETTNSTRTAV